MTREIPLLSPRDLLSFSPAEFKEYVKSLYFKEERAKKKEVAWTVTKKGSLVIRVNRIPKVIWPHEISTIAKESGIEERLIWIKIAAPKSKIKIARNNRGTPWPAK